MARSRFRLAGALTRPRTVFASLAMSLALSGCYVDVTEVPEHEADYDTEVTDSVADYSTSFLTRTALVPYALTGVSIEMVADPDAFLTPSSRGLARSHLPVESTETYLFEDGPCDFGGNTGIEANGTTDTYSDGMTFVTMAVTATATACGTRNWLGDITLDSQLDYDVNGWYDDVLHRIDSLEGHLTGHVRMRGDYKDINIAGLRGDILELSSTDFRIDTEASLWLDDGWVDRNADLVTDRSVHWYRGDRYPHAGRVRIEGFRGWVLLTFSDGGVSRTDSDGYREYRSWASFD